MSECSRFWNKGWRPDNNVAEFPAFRATPAAIDVTGPSVSRLSKDLKVNQDTSLAGNTKRSDGVALIDTILKCLDRNRGHGGASVSCSEGYSKPAVHILGITHTVFERPNYWMA